MPFPSFDMTTITGGAAALVAAWRAYLRLARAGKDREVRERLEKAEPIFRNGDAAAIRDALSLLGSASKSYRERLAQLEEDAAEGRREHARLDDRLSDLEHRFRALRDEKT